MTDEVERDMDDLNAKIGGLTKDVADLTEANTAWAAKADEDAKTIADLTAKLADAGNVSEALKAHEDVLIQALTDPENQPSQYGTYPAAMYDALKKDNDEKAEVIEGLSTKLADARAKIEAAEAGIANAAERAEALHGSIDNLRIPGL